MRLRCFILIISSLLILFGCTQPNAGLKSPCEETELVYQRQSFWTEEEFLDMWADKAKFESGFKAELEATSKNYRITTGEFEFCFDQESCSTIATCHIDGAISKRGKQCRGRFGWLLEPIGLDFINSNFEQSNHGLSWEGITSGISITIEIECPPQDCIYKAWQEPVGHCHQHIWWPISSQKEMVKCIEIRRHT